MDSVKNVLCTVRVEGGLVVSSYTFSVGDGTVTANTRMTPDEAEGYRFTLAALILFARGGVAPRKELVDRMAGRLRLIAAARLPAEPPSDDDATRTEPVPMYEARALVDYIAKLEALLRELYGAVERRELGQDVMDSVLCGTRELLGLDPAGPPWSCAPKEDPNGTPPVPDPQH